MRIGSASETGTVVLAIATPSITNGQNARIEIAGGTLSASTTDGVKILNDITGGLTIGTGATAARLDIGTDASGNLNNLAGNANGSISYSGPGSYTLVAVNTADTVFGGVIEDAAAAETVGLLMNGPGKLTFSGVNLYQGATSINGGTLALAGNGSLATSQDIRILAGATFDISGTTSGATVKDIEFNGGGGDYTVKLGGKSLTLLEADGGGRRPTLEGGTGIDTYAVNLKSTVSAYDLSGLLFTNWTVAPTGSSSTVMRWPIHSPAHRRLM